MAQQQIRSKPSAAGAAPAARKLERTRHKLVAAIRAEIAASGDFTAERHGYNTGWTVSTWRRAANCKSRSKALGKLVRVLNKDRETGFLTKIWFLSRLEGSGGTR